MSEKIEQIIDVLRIMVNDYNNNPNCNLPSSRIEATKCVANKRNIRVTTVSNKYRRCLGLQGTDAFQGHCESWLRNREETRLRNILSEQAIDNDDTIAINDFFRHHQN